MKPQMLDDMEELVRREFSMALNEPESDARKALTTILYIMLDMITYARRYADDRTESAES